MTPYYKDDFCTIYHGDCRDIAHTIDKPELVLADPPYGISHPCDFKSRGRAKLAECKDYPDVHGDNVPFDPSMWVGQPCILWGGNHFANKLPPSGGWLVWDKRRPDELDQSTCELAWTNCVKGVRRFSYLWNGMMREGKEPLVHPTQKPAALLHWCLSLKWTKDFKTILDPYMGSGPTLIAAKSLGKKCTGIEIEERYCEIAAKNLSESCGLFENPPTIIPDSIIGLL